jgi:hypothetical protein
MQIENFYVLVGVVLPKLDGIFVADVDVHATICMVGFGVIGKLLRIVPDVHKAVSQSPLLGAGKRFEKFNDLVVNE